MLAIGAILTQDLIRKHDQPIVYAFRQLNIIECNFSTTRHEALAMVFALHNFKHYLLGISLCFCRPYDFGVFDEQTTCSNHIARWLFYVFGI